MSLIVLSFLFLRVDAIEKEIMASLSRNLSGGAKNTSLATTSAHFDNLSPEQRAAFSVHLSFFFFFFNFTTQAGFFFCFSFFFFGGRRSLAMTRVLTVASRIRRGHH